LRKKNPTFTTIGDFADKFFDSNPGKEKEKVFLDEKYFCLAFNSKGEVKLFPIRGIIRHKADSHRMFEVVLAYGRKIIVSEHSSFFTLVNGKVECIETKNLKSGDIVLVPAKIILPEEKELKIDLLKKFLKIGPPGNLMVESDKLEDFLSRRAYKKVKDFFGEVVLFSKKQREIIRNERLNKKLTQSQLAKAIGISKSVLSLFERGKCNLKKENADKLLKLLELSLKYKVKVDGRATQVLKLVKKKNKSRKSVTKNRFLMKSLDSETLNYLLEECNDLKLYLEGTNNNRTKFPRFLEIDEDLAFFLGVFVADGSINKKMKIVRIFLGTKKRFYKECKKRIIKFLKKRGISYTIFKTKEFVEEIRIYSQIMLFLLADILKAGTKRVNGRRGVHKNIPDILFSAPKKVKRAFIEGYLKSDGYFVKGEYLISTVSEKIYKKLPYLSHSCNPPVVFTRVKNTSTGVIYLGHTVKYERVKGVFGNLVAILVISVKEVKCPTSWVYSLLVETDMEGNFICGYGGICQQAVWEDLE